MTRRLLAVAAIMLIATGVVLFGVQTTQAQATLSDEQRERIRTNCVTIKNTLNQLKVSDALLRVNRGQIYESMSSKLMDNFNARVSNNNLDNHGLVAVSSGYDSALNNFRSDYQTYERQLSSATRIDCTEDPDGFHFAIQNARTLREEVNSDVQRLHEYIDDYRSAVNDFRLNFERTNGEDE